MGRQNITKLIEEIDVPISFIIGSYITTGLGIARSLGRQGVPVIWIDYKPSQSGFYSKYCEGLVCPNPKEKEEKYIDFLLEIGEKLNQKGVLFPISDTNTLTLLKYKKKLEKYYTIPMSDIETAKIFINKQIFYWTLEKHDIPIPKTYFPLNISDVRDISEEINYPCLIKPAYSDSFRYDFKTKLFVADSNDKLIDEYMRAGLKHHDVVIQEVVPGDAGHMYGFNAYYDKNFEPYGAFMYHRIREWPHDFGNGCLIENVDDPELAETVYSLFNKIKFHGIFDAELKKDPRDNSFKFIEINARSWMQNSFPERCGINIYYMTYLDAIGKDIKQTKPSVENTKWLFVSIDTFSSFKSIIKRDLSVNEWLDSFKGKKNYAIFSWDDPAPFFYYLCRANQ